MSRVYFDFLGRIRAASLAHRSVLTCLRSCSLGTVTYQRFWMSGSQLAGERGADAAGEETALGAVSVAPQCQSRSSLLSFTYGSQLRD